MFQAEKDGDKGVFGSKMLSDNDIKKFEEVNRYFVDETGWGQGGEPALTGEQFLKKVQKGKFYAIIECGQFQVHVGEYVKKE